MLINLGWTDESGNLLPPLEDLYTRDKIRLGKLNQEQYHIGYIILDKFPAFLHRARPRLPETYQFVRYIPARSRNSDWWSSFARCTDL